MQHTHIEKALSLGHRLHAFRSGGGLRVVRVWDSKGATSGYGEHPHVDDALTHANLDLERGTLPYDQVYGVIFPHYLTGSSKASSPLDAWLLKGSKFDIRKDGDKFVFDLDGYQSLELPDSVKQRIDAGEKAVTWRSPRGYHYQTHITNRFGAEKSISTQVLISPTINDTAAFMWRIKKTGQASTLSSALAEAWKASPIEQY
jgi:hypothetical protein